MPDRDSAPHDASLERASDERSDKPLKWSQIMLSTLSAGFGVQSGSRRERDFKGGSVESFVIAGLALTTVFVLTLLAIVRTIGG